LIIHGLEENKNKPWETREETEAIFAKFLFEGLGIKSKDVILADIHRLPQQPIFNGSVKINRPIIFKLTSTFDKHAIMSRLKQLKNYYSQLKENNPSAPYVYLSEHLPKEFYEQKKRLLPLYKNAKKATWSIQNGKYCLFVDGIKVDM